MQRLLHLAALPLGDRRVVVGRIELAAVAAPVFSTARLTSRSSCALSSLKGRDWSCFKNIVSRMALSGVGAGFSAGAVAVCAMAAALNTKKPASAAIVANRDHRETALSCKAGPDRYSCCRNQDAGSGLTLLAEMPITSSQRQQEETRCR
jgi:hypothetical protein